jgi:hypothetical protein
LEPEGGLSAGEGRQGSIKPVGADRLVRELNEDMGAKSRTRMTKASALVSALVRQSRT